MADDKKHFWMAAIEIAAVHPGNEDAGVAPYPMSVKINVLTETARKRMDADAMDTLRQAALMKAQEKYELDPSWVANFFFFGIYYLGLMSPKEYMGRTQPTKIVANE
ncbi:MULTISPECIES: hypothetical protein [Pseudomonadota]|uniref:hypothetical protein n=1 Tax=Pseudomonadota TaxID=1224 RepID=UPI0026371FCF|nr:MULTISPECIES: hypothetical protein [Pseudomonadota]